MSYEAHISIIARSPWVMYRTCNFDPLSEAAGVEVLTCMDWLVKKNKQVPLAKATLQRWMGSGRQLEPLDSKISQLWCSGSKIGGNLKL